MNMITEFVTDPWNVGMVLLGLIISIILWIRGKETENLRGFIPTLWTSLGILGTFMAIYVSLSGYTSNTETFNSQNNVDFNISSLIREVIPAFSTSIIGIIGSIISTIINRWVCDEKERTNNEQFLSIKQKIPGEKIISNSPEMVLLEIISAIRETGNKTCEMLNSINDTFISKIDVLCKKIEIVRETTSNVGGIIRSEINAALQQQQVQFSSAFSSLSQAFVENLKAQSDILVTKMDELRRMLNDEVKNIENTNQVLLTQLINQERDLLKLATDRLEKDSENRNVVLQNFVTNHNKQLNDSFAEITAGMEALYQKICDQIEHHIEAEKDLFEYKIKDSIEEFAKAQYKTCSDTIAKCNEDLISSTAVIHEGQEKAFAQLISRLREMFDKICASFEIEIQTLSNKLADSLQNINEENITVLQDTIGHNSNMVQSILYKHSESINTTSEQVKNHQIKIYEEISKEITRLQELMNNQLDGYLNGISETMSQANEFMKSNSQNVFDVTTTINKAMTNLNSSIVRSNGDLTKNIDDLKNQIVNSLGDLSEDMANKISEGSQIKQLEMTALRLNEEFNKLIMSNKENMVRFDNIIRSSVEAIKTSARIYSDAVSKSDVITKYMEGTTRLFMDHTNAVAVLEKSMTSMEGTINRMCDNMSTPNNRNTKSKTAD